MGCLLSCSCTAEYYVSTQESEMKLCDTSSILSGEVGQMSKNKIVFEKSDKDI